MSKTKIDVELFEIQYMGGGGNVIGVPVKVCDIEAYEIREEGTKGKVNEEED